MAPSINILKKASRVNVANNTENERGFEVDCVGYLNKEIQLSGIIQIFLHLFDLKHTSSHQF